MNMLDSARKEYCTDYSLADLVGDSQISSTCGEYIVTCPICKVKKEREDIEYQFKPYTKRKLYITEDLGVGHCFVCETIFLDKDGISRLKKYDNWKTLAVSESELIYIPYTRKVDFDEESKQYLIDRCPQLYSKIDLTKFGILPTKGRLVIQFYLNNLNYYYQLRFINPEIDNNGNRYYSPYTGNLGKPLYFAFGKFNPSYPTVIVEGVFTAIAEKMVLGNEFNVIAILGHSITNYQLSMLQSSGQFGPIYVHMDTNQFSINVMNELKSKFPNVKYLRSFSEEFDSEEIIRRGFSTPFQYHEYLINQINSLEELRID